MSRTMMDRKEAAKYIGIAPGTLANWDSTGRFNIPKYRIGRLIRYKIEDLDTWLEEQREEVIH